MTIGNRLHLLCLAEDDDRRRRLEASCEAMAEIPATELAVQLSRSSHGDDALGLLAGGRVDAVLTDLVPEATLAFVKRARDAGIVAPILVVTPTMQADVWQRLLAAGADELLPATGLSPLLLERSLRLCTRTQALESRLDYLSQHDLLTGLPNYKLFERQLELALHTARRHGRCVALICVHLDDFQEQVLQAGQAAGERLLKTSASRLRTLLRRSDLVARGQGGEFLLLLECTADLGELASTAERIRDRLTATADGGETVCASVSMGIAAFPHSSEEPKVLLDHARAALKQVLDAGGNDFRLYDETLEVISHRRVLMERALPGAIGRGELSVRFQPRFDLASRRITGAEVLLRWHSPDFGAVSPELFIPVAESIGAIRRIGGWVLEQAVRAARRWLDGGHRLRLAVNVSGGQFAGTDFPVQLAELLAQSGVPAELLELELTEGVFVANVAEHRELFDALTDLGVGLAVDDFGTGYSALAYLRHFPVHALKIDRTFIAPLPASSDDGAIVRAIIAMAHALGLRIVAEGVDAPDQVRFLREAGCDEIQGYLVAEPLTAEAFQNLLDRGPPAPDAWPL